MAVQFPNMPTDWGQYLPQPEQYQTAQDYFAALRAAHDNADFNQPAWGPPPDMSSMGPGWHAAGTTHAPSLGVQGAHDFQGAYERQFQEGVKSPAMTLALGSRAALHPDEAQHAYDAYALSPEGLPNPLMDPAVYTALKALGYTNSAPPPPANLLPIQTDPNYVRDEAARRQATINQYRAGPPIAGGGSGLLPGTPPGAGPVQRPGVNDPVRQPASAQRPVSGDQTPISAWPGRSRRRSATGRSTS
jgi:hypothetical protein